MKKFIILIIILILVLLFVKIASANQSYFSSGTKSATATTSVNYMPVGTATTTISYDTYDGGNMQKTDRAIVMLQSVASSSASVQTINVQYSMDGIDWFSLVNDKASTTPSQVLDNALAYTLAGNTTSSTTRRALFLETPTRFVRVSIANTTGNGSIWGWILPWKERNN